MANKKKPANYKGFGERKTQQPPAFIAWFDNRGELHESELIVAYRTVRQTRLLAGSEAFGGRKHVESRYLHASQHAARVALLNKLRDERDDLYVKLQCVQARMHLVEALMQIPQSRQPE